MSFTLMEPDPARSSALRKLLADTPVLPPAEMSAKLAGNADRKNAGWSEQAAAAA